MVCGDPPAYRTNRSLIEIAACDGVMLRHLDLSGSGGPGIFINASRRVEAGDCAVADAGMEGISVGASRQVSIHDCRIDRSRDHGIKVTWVGSIDRSPQYVRIEKNKIADVQQGAGIGLLSGDNVEVVGNEIHGGRLGGIAIYEKARLFSHQHIHVAKNSIDHSPAGTPTYVTGAISVWNLIYANVDPARIDLTIEENHFGDGVSVPIWVGLKSSSLHSLTLKDNVMDSGAPVSATFDEPDLVGKNIAQHSP
jgi:hypothetical protein